MASADVQRSGTAPHELVNAQQTSYQPAQAPKPHHIIAEFNYYKDPGDGSLPTPNYVDKPLSYNEKPIDTRKLPVHDVRGHEDTYTLDKDGFQYHKQASVEKDFLDDEQIKAQYYPEVEQILKDVTGASKIFIFDHTIRRQQKDDRSKSADEAAKTLRGPVQRVHIDQSYDAAPNRVLHHLPDEASELLKGRFQIINVWRPIKPIYKDPLGIAAANSVPDSDLVPIKLIYPDREGETYTVKPGDGEHKWYYLYGQQPDEALLIKCFDSKLDGRARRVPHSAFANPETEDREPRESIEVRTLVFHPDDRD